MEDKTGAVQMTEVVFPEHANHYGTLFAGNALMLMSKAAFVAARQAARTDVVMASCGDVQFLAPVKVGSVLQLEAWLSRIGRTSMTVSVTGTADLLGSEPVLALNGRFEMVAVDPQGRPARIPPHLLQETP